MTKRSMILSMMGVAWMMAAATVEAASIRNVYFSNGTMVEGQIVRSEGQLPGPTKTFEADKDRVARLFIILGDFDAHTLRGELKATDGTVVRTMNRQLSSSSRANVTWRYLWQNFNLQGLAPGEYRIDLVVDDAKVGTYTFMLK